MSDTLALPARRQQTASYRFSDELWQSIHVHVSRIALEVVSAKVRGKQAPCVGFFTLLGVLRSCVIARVLLLSWDGCCLSLRSCSPFTWLLLARIRALPRSPGGRSCRGILEPPSPRSLFTRMRLLYCAAGQSALPCSIIMLALTPASSTPVPCPPALFATLVTSRRRVHDQRRREALSSQGLPVSRLHLRSSCPSLHKV